MVFTCWSSGLTIMRWKLSTPRVTLVNMVLMASNLVLLGLFVTSGHSGQQVLMEQNQHILQQQPVPNCQNSELDKLLQERVGSIDPDWAWKSDWDGMETSVVGKPGLVWSTRRVFLVRHGAYHKDGPQQGHLNTVGIRQMEKTGERLKRMNQTYSSIIISSSIRATESADIILKHISTSHTKIEKTSILREGRPTFPNPGIDTWDPNDPSFKEDRTRIEEAFRTYIYRPEAGQETNYNDLIVAHGNVISYFTLRALQLPPERWGKLGIYQGSITLLEVHTNGEIFARFLGDVGHISITDWTGT